MPGPVQITPFVRCASLARQRGVLGFECAFQADNYAFLRHGRVALRLLECPPEPDGRTLGYNQSFYFDVEGIDALYGELKAGLDRLAPGRVRAPFDQDYGQREFHVLDEDGTLVFFGQSIA